MALINSDRGLCQALIPAGFWGGLAALTLALPAQADVAGQGGSRSLGTLINGERAGRCTAGVCVVGGGTRAGENLFHRLSSFDTRGSITGVRFQNQRNQTVIVGVNNPFGSWIDKTIKFDNPGNLLLLSPGGIHLGPGAGFQQINQLGLSTATRLAMQGGGAFDVLSTTAFDAATLAGTPLFKAQGLQVDADARQAAGITGVPGIVADGIEVTVDQDLFLDAVDGAVQVRDSQITVQPTQGLGGALTLTGQSVEITGATQLKAQGPAGGGEIRIGGGQRGENLDVRNAQQVLLDAGTQVLADATGHGAGGRVIVWSDQRTEVHGTISAQAGPEGGDGGFVETSSAQVLQVTGRVSTAAPKGNAGQWLLDPEEVAITSEADATAATEASSDQQTSSISAESLQQAVDEGTAVTVESQGAITGADQVQPSPESGGTLSTVENRAASTTATTEPSAAVVPSESSAATTGSDQQQQEDDEEEQPTQSPEVASASSASTTEQAPVPSVSQPAETSVTTRLFLDGVDLTLNRESASIYAGHNLVIEACSASCAYATNGSIFLDGLSGLSSLEILAPTRIELRGDLSVAQRLTFQGDVFLAGPSITLAASALEIARPIQLASTLSVAPSLQITTSQGAQMIQVGAALDPQPTAIAPLQLQGSTLAHLNQAPVAQLTIGGLDNTGGIRVSGALSSPQQLQLTSRGAVQVDSSAALQASQRLGIEGSQVTIAGSLTAGDGLRGGEITVVGDHVALAETARITASGENSGGLIQLGGSWQNSNPSIRQAIKATVASGARVDASATQRGDGGTIVVWSDIRNPESLTNAFGTFSANAGLLGGDGGRIETSGYGLNVDGIQISTSAEQGRTGVWLLDPADITISSAPTTSGVNQGTQFSSASLSQFTVNAGDLQAALASSNVLVTTASSGTAPGNITYDVSSAISTVNNTLTLSANNNIIFNGSYTSTGSGGLVLQAAGGVTGSSSGAIALNGGTVEINTGILNTSSPFLSPFTGTISGAGTNLTKLGQGIFELGSSQTYTGSTNISAGTLRLTGASIGGGLSDLSPVNVAAGATFSHSKSSPETIGSLSGDGNVQIVTSFGTLAVGANNNSTTFSGVISGAGSLEKVGTGTLTLSGLNTYGTAQFATATKVSDGVLAVTSDAALGFIPQQPSSQWITLSNGKLEAAGTFTLNANRGISLVASGAIGSQSGQMLTYNGSISNVGANAVALALEGPGTIALGGSSTYVGNTTLATTVVFNNPNALSTGSLTFDASQIGPVEVSSGRLVYGTGITADLSSRFAGSQPRPIIIDTNGQNIAYASSIAPNANADFVKTGAGQLTLAAASTLDSVSVQQGKLRLENSLALGNTAVVSLFGGSELNIGYAGASPSPAVFARPVNVLTPSQGSSQHAILSCSTTCEFSGSIDLSEDLRILAQGISQTPSSISITLSHSPSAVTALGGGAFELDFAQLPSTASASAITTGTFNVNTRIATGLGGIRVSAAPTGSVVLGAENTFTGPVNIDQGILALIPSSASPPGPAGILRDSVAVNIGPSGIFDVSAFETIGSLAGASGSQVTLGPTVTLFVGGNNATTTFAGSIGEVSFSSPGQLIKEGTGQLTLTGANTYTGGTIVLGGVLTVSGSVQPPITCSAGGSSNLCSGSNSGSSSSSGPGSFFPDGPFSDSPPLNPDGDLVDNTSPQAPPPNGQDLPENIPFIDEFGDFEDFSGFFDDPSFDFQDEDFLATLDGLEAVFGSFKEFEDYFGSAEGFEAYTELTDGFRGSEEELAELVGVFGKFEEFDSFFDSDREINRFALLADDFGGIDQFEQFFGSPTDFSSFDQLQAEIDRYSTYAELFNEFNDFQEFTGFIDNVELFLDVDSAGQGVIDNVDLAIGPDGSGPDAFGLGLPSSVDHSGPQASMPSPESVVTLEDADSFANAYGENRIQANNVSVDVSIGSSFFTESPGLSDAPAPGPETGPASSPSSTPGPEGQPQVSSGSGPAAGEAGPSESSAASSVRSATSVPAEQAIQESSKADTSQAEKALDSLLPEASGSGVNPLTPQQIQQRLQNAIQQIRQGSFSDLRSQAVPLESAPWLSDQEFLIAALPTTGIQSDAASPALLPPRFDRSRYNPAVLHIRFTESSTATSKDGAFLDLTLMPSQGQPEGKRVDVSRGEFASDLKQIYRQLSRQESLDVQNPQSPSRRLYSTIFSAIEPILAQQGITTLLISADRGLQAVPFAALHNGSRYFGEAFGFSLTPSLALTSLDPPIRAQGKLLAAGSAVFDGLAPLPLVPTELNQVGQSAKKDKVLNREFTPSTLMVQAGDHQYSRVHIATHAEFLPGGPAASRLYSGTVPIPLSDFVKLRRDREGSPLDLISFSACRTALGDADTELGFVGLALQSGARSAVGTLWYVDDVATSAYFVQMYRYLDAGVPKAEALQLTRQAFIRGLVNVQGDAVVGPSGDALIRGLTPSQQRRFERGFANPYFWAGIELMGSAW